MLNNTGTKELDKILNVGKSPNVIWGLSYCGKEMRKTQVSSPATCSSITFVQPESMTASESMKAQPTTRFKEQTTKHDLTEKRVFKRGCNSCGREGHVARFYYERFDNIQRTWKGGMCYPEPNTYGCVWVPKSVLYARKGVDDFDDEFNVIVDISQLKDEGKVNLKHKVVEEPSDGIELLCNLSLFELEDEPTEDVQSLVAYMSSKKSQVTSWYFDSGCSRHLTGKQQVLTSYTEISGGKVTFGDGGNGTVRGVGNVKDSNQPSLINVYYVEDLKANLISISQLCDEGLEIVFTKTDCQAINDKGNIILEEIRYGNNCYMWKPSNTCLSAT